MIINKKYLKYKQKYLQLKKYGWNKIKHDYKSKVPDLKVQQKDFLIQ